jgi:hypothetical protein
MSEGLGGAGPFLWNPYGVDGLALARKPMVCESSNHTDL